MATLGTLSSANTGTHSQLYYVSLKRRLAVGELVNGTPTVTSTEPEFTIANVAVNTSALVNFDGSAPCAVGQAVEFRVTTTKDVSTATNIPIVINYATDASNYCSVNVTLAIDETVTVA